MRSLPGSPFFCEEMIDQSVLEALYNHYGLDKPWWEQYFGYLKGAFFLDFGFSLKYPGETLISVIKQAFPISASVGLIALTLAIFIGSFIGIIASLFQGRWIDRLLINSIGIGLSVPTFIKATFLQYFFGVFLHVLPIAQWGTFSHKILPALTLCLMPAALVAKFIRNQMGDILKKDYIATAYNKGLSTSQVVFNHALPNCIIPLVAYLPPLISHMLTGSFVVEKIFGVPGLGGWFMSSILNRDYTLIIGLTCFYSLLLMSLSLISDILLLKIDPQWERRAFAKK